MIGQKKKYSSAQKCIFSWYIISKHTCRSVLFHPHSDSPFCLKNSVVSMASLWLTQVNSLDHMTELNNK